MKRGILFLLVALTSCVPVAVDTFGSISGTVTSSETGAPLSGVTVSLIPPGLSQVTGSNGSFQFDNLDVQEYTVSFTKDDCKPASQKVSVKPGITSSIQMVMSPVPAALSVEPVQLEFGSSSTSMALDITNAGKGTLAWYITEDLDWLSCNPSSGTVITGKDPVTVSVSRTGLEHGSYSGTFVISSNGGSQTVTVRMNVETMMLSVYPAHLDFGSISSTEKVSLTNAGTGSVSYTVTSSNDWLTVSKTSGLVTGRDNFNAIVSRSGLSAGQYTGTLIISTNAGEVSIPVNMEVASDEKPTVRAEGIEELGYNSARLKGILISPGGSKVIRHGFCWSMSSSSPSLSDFYSNLGDATEAKAFSAMLTNLEPETAYFARAFAENEGGISYSNEVLTFTTLSNPTLPSVNTGNIHDISYNSAMASGVLTGLGNLPSVSSYGHVWSTSENPTIELGTRVDLGVSSETKTFTSPLEGLSAGEKYFVRAYAVNNLGVSYGDNVVFTTKTPDKPEVATLSATGITDQAATLRGEVKNNGGTGITDCGFYYGKSESNMKKRSVSAFDNGFSQTLSDLDYETTYYFKAYAVNSVGESTGETLSFSTEKLHVPEVTTVSSTDVTYTSATLTGKVSSYGGSDLKEYGFYYGMGSNPNKKIVVGTSVSGTFSFSLVGLENGTTYSFKAYAVNSKGTGFGQVKSFTTRTDPYNGHEYVDLGLPSGTKWATMNIGASSPGEDGSYFQWGCTVEGNQGNPMSNYRGTICGTEYDAARVLWKGTWAIPSMTQVYELFQNCSVDMVTMYGKRCYLLTSRKNGKTIVLAGFNSGSNGSTRGIYWSGNPGDYFPDSYTEAYFFNGWGVSSASSAETSKASLMPIRPVCK